MDDHTKATRPDPVWLTPEAASFDAFRRLVEQTPDPADWPHAARIERNVLIYDGPAIARAAADPAARRALAAEWATALATGPGVIVIAGAYPDPAPLDRATALFTRIEEQHRTRTGGGDHFAKPGANDRIWNALEKHCRADPDGFALYYGNEAIAIASESWLGPNYQSREPRRRRTDCPPRLPPRLHDAGGSRALPRPRPPPIPGPHPPGRGRARRHAARDRPDAAPPLEPALPRGLSRLRAPRLPGLVPRPSCPAPAREGRPSLPRPRPDARRRRQPQLRPLPHGQPPPGLLRLRPSHGGDRPHRHDARPLSRAPRLRAGGRLTEAEAGNAIAAAAEGYAFPTNLDTDPPVGGLAPKSQARLVREALAAGTAPDAFATLVHEHAARRHP